MVKVRRHYASENETHNARNIELIAQHDTKMMKQGSFCRVCNRWSVALNAEKCLCKHCEKREKEMQHRQR